MSEDHHRTIGWSQVCDSLREVKQVYGNQIFIMLGERMEASQTPGRVYWTEDQIRKLPCIGRYTILADSEMDAKNFFSFCGINLNSLLMANRHKIDVNPAIQRYRISITSGGGFVDVDRRVAHELTAIHGQEIASSVVAHWQRLREMSGEDRFLSLKKILLFRYGALENFLLSNAMQWETLHPIVFKPSA